MFRHILLPIDGSLPSKRAAKLAASLAREHHAKLTALHVMTPFSPAALSLDAPTGPAELYSERAYRGLARSRASKVLAKAKKAAMTAGVACEGVAVEAAQPWSAIRRTARSRGCDLIVMGSHARRGLEKMWLGSETTEVLTHSTTPVLVCR